MIEINRTVRDYWPLPRARVTAKLAAIRSWYAARGLYTITVERG